MNPDELDEFFEAQDNIDQEQEQPQVQAHNYAKNYYQEQNNNYYLEQQEYEKELLRQENQRLAEAVREQEQLRLLESYEAQNALDENKIQEHKNLLKQIDQYSMSEEADHEKLLNYKNDLTASLMDTMLNSKLRDMQIQQMNSYNYDDSGEIEYSLPQNYYQPQPQNVYYPYVQESPQMYSNDPNDYINPNLVNRNSDDATLGQKNNYDFKNLTSQLKKYAREKFEKDYSQAPNHVKEQLNPADYYAKEKENWNKSRYFIDNKLKESNNGEIIFSVTDLKKSGIVKG